LFHHRVCEACGFTFNAKTGRSNRGPVVAYAGVCFAVALGIVGAMYANAVWRAPSLDLTAFKRGCMRTCSATAPAAQCEAGCSCFVRELEQMDPKKVRAVLDSAASAKSAKSLPPELQEAQKRCANASGSAQ
jgi:hypothetical protein